MQKRTTRRSKTTAATPGRGKRPKPGLKATRPKARKRSGRKPSLGDRVAPSGAGQAIARAPKPKLARTRAPRPTPNLRTLDVDANRFGESEASFHLEGSGEGVDGLAEELGEAFVENVTGADDAAMEHREVRTEDERGGPFVITSGRTEFANGVDASNPLDAERAPLPTV